MIPSESDVRLMHFAARTHAHDSPPWVAATLNRITEEMILAGDVPDPATTNDDVVPTVWVRGRHGDWPYHLIEKYGWDGRKKRS